jgi:hypothetical protein
MSLSDHVSSPLQNIISAYYRTPTLLSCIVHHCLPSQPRIMGIKRKASDSLSPHPISSTPSTTSPSQDHPNTNALHPFHSTSNPTHLTGWGTPESYFSSNNLNSSSHSSIDSDALHLNSRTRKRLRDNRPDEETIHQNTLSRLYAAQQKHDEQTPEQQQDDNLPLTPSPTPSRASLARAGSTTSTTSTRTYLKEKAQTSLHTFFGGRQPHTSSTIVQIPGPTITSTHPASVPQCEGCSAPLLLPSHPSTTPLDTEMMDIDNDLNLTAASNNDDDGRAYACASCSKRVCDTCAVRGDWRVCLECANPGNGHGHAVGHGYLHSGGGSCGMEAGTMYGYGERGEQKRWVGGIGWL